jgi:hypothetical protein
MFGRSSRRMMRCGCEVVDDEDGVDDEEADEKREEQEEARVRNAWNFWVRVSKPRVQLI